MTEATLKKLPAKKELRILGLNSGTSADGIDLALIRFSYSGRKTKISFVAGEMQTYPRRIKLVLERIIQDKTIPIEEMGRFDIAYGSYLGTAAARFLHDTGHKADLIASHGQTIAHYPAQEKTLGQKCGTTIQIGDGNAVAAESNLPVVSDFRRTDIASGGEGAPLTPFVNQLLFGDKKKSRIIVNIGGIANFSYHPAGETLDAVRGGDCGPGNILSDTACRLLFHKKYDIDGRLAARGMVHDEIIEAIAEANKHRRVSAGREQFDHYLMARLVHITRRLKAEKYDLIASIDEATARLIHRSLKAHLQDRRLEGVYITGGGRKNLQIMRRLEACLGAGKVHPIEELGYDGDFLEAVSFAVLGGCFIYGIPSTLPHITGGKKGGIAGKLSLPPKG